MGVPLVAFRLKPRIDENGHEVSSYKPVSDTPPPPAPLLRPASPLPFYDPPVALHAALYSLKASPLKGHLP